MLPSGKEGAENDNLGRFFCEGDAVTSSLPVVDYSGWVLLNRSGVFVVDAASSPFKLGTASSS